MIIFNILSNDAKNNQSSHISENNCNKFLFPNREAPIDAASGCVAHLVRASVFLLSTKRSRPDAVWRDLSPQIPRANGLTTGSDHRDDILIVLWLKTLKNGTRSSSQAVSSSSLWFLGQRGVNRKPQGLMLSWKCLYKALLWELYPKCVGKYSQAQWLRLLLLLLLSSPDPPTALLLPPSLTSSSNT